MTIKLNSNLYVRPVYIYIYFLIFYAKNEFDLKCCIFSKLLNTNTIVLSYNMGYGVFLIYAICEIKVLSVFHFFQFPVAPFTNMV